MLETLNINREASLVPRNKKSKKEAGGKLVTGKRAESIYKEPIELQKALTRAGLEIQEQEAIKNLGPVLGKRLKQLSAEHAGGQEQQRTGESAEALAAVRAEIATTGKTQGISKRYNENVISRDLYRAARESDKKKERQSRLITSEEKKSVSGEINNEYELSKLVTDKKDEEARISKAENNWQRAKELRSEKAQAAYVQAYREYDPRFTKNKADDLIAITRPPFLVFGSPAKELKRLHGVMVKARANVAHEDENKKIQENLAVGGGIKFKDSEAGLKSGEREFLGWANEAEERAAEIKRGQTDADVDKFLDKTRKHNLNQDVVKADRVRYDLLQAYKKMGVNITKDKAEEVLIKKPPFSYLFSEKGRKVRDLYDKYVKKLK